MTDFLIIQQLDVPLNHVVWKRAFERIHQHAILQELGQHLNMNQIILQAVKLQMLWCVIVVRC